MQSAAELLKKHMLLLHCGLPAVSPSSYSWGNNADTHIWKHALSLEPSSGNHKVQMQQWHNTVKTQQRKAPNKHKNTHVTGAKLPRSIPSCGTLEFLALSLSSDVSLLTALPLLVLLRTLNARFNLLKERLLTEDRSKFLTAEETGGEREALYRLAHPQHARTCLKLPPHSQSDAFSCPVVRTVFGVLP